MSWIPRKKFDDSAKDRYFLRFNNDNKNMLVNSSEGNSFIFPLMLPKHPHIH